MTKHATPTMMARISNAERKLIGTEEYHGLYSYFHAWEYRHYLRHVPKAVYRRVYMALLKAGLDPSGESELHLKIISKLTKRYPL